MTDTNQLPPSEREAFEAEMRCEETWGHRSLKRRPDGRYQNWQVDLMWEAWQARAQVQGEPVYWEWRHLGNNQFAADFGQWSEWKRVEARNPIFTAEDELRTLRRYIADGYKYELRALYTTPQPAQATQAASAEDMEVYDSIADRYFREAAQTGVTDEQIKEAATKAVKAGKLSWLGFEKDDQDKYTLPVISKSHYQFARAILALRPLQVPMTDDDVDAECLTIIGHLLSRRERDRIVWRMAEAHHGITAQAKKEGA